MSKELKLPEIGSRWIRNGFDKPKDSKFVGTSVTVIRIGRSRASGIIIVHYLRDGNKTPSYWHLEGFYERYQPLLSVENQTSAEELQQDPIPKVGSRWRAHLDKVPSSIYEVIATDPGNPDCYQRVTLKLINWGPQHEINKIPVDYTFRVEPQWMTLRGVQVS